jgi:hypothetical protein
MGPIMRYVIKWLRGGTVQEMHTRETTAAGALDVAAALLETRPSDIWIESESGEKIADYADIVAAESAFAPGFAGTVQAPASILASMKPEPAPTPAPGQVEAPVM